MANHTLEYHERLVGHVVGVWARLGRADAVQPKVAQIADELAYIRTERERISPEHPDHSDQSPCS